MTIKATLRMTLYVFSCCTQMLPNFIRFEDRKSVQIPKVSGKKSYAEQSTTDRKPKNTLKMTKTINLHKTIKTGKCVQMFEMTKSLYAEILTVAQLHVVYRFYRFLPFLASSTRRFSVRFERHTQIIHIIFAWSLFNIRCVWYEFPT